MQLKYSNYVVFSHFHGKAVNNSGLGISEQRLVESQNEVSELRSKLSSMETAYQDTVADSKRLKKELDTYRTMSPDEYLKLGTELFTLEKLTYILGRAQSDSFITVQKEQKRNVLQRLVNDIQILLFPIRTDNDLLNLLSIVEPYAENDIKDIQINLEKVSLQEIVYSEVIDKRHCVLQERIHLPQIIENGYVFDAENAAEYMRKIALSKLASIFYQIANW